MMLSYIVLAQAQAVNNHTEIVWPWFIIGCVLLVVAIIAFFWGFAIRNITSSQYTLLMWILPLSSGFAVGCFAGSLNATGPVGQFTVTAAGGFAVWLLSYFLIPKPDGKAPDSDSFLVLPGMSFRGAAQAVAEPEGYSVAFTGFDDSILNAKLREGQMTAGGTVQLMEKLGTRFVDESINIQYKVVRDSNAGVYLIDRS
jgi:hypothetical protein